MYGIGCTCVTCFHLRNIGKARRVLTEDATKTVMQSLVMSRLDYCNALLIGIQQDLIAKLQRLQNSAARIVSRTRKYEHITPVLIKLHWLPIKFRIQFKVLLLVYKALNGLAPKYIKELLVPYKHRRHLRSEAKGLLDEPRTRLKCGDRAFSISSSSSMFICCKLHFTKSYILINHILNRTYKLSRKYSKQCHKKTHKFNNRKQKRLYLRRGRSESR